MILNKLEAKEKKTEEISKVSLKLDKVYLRLISLYLQIEQGPQAKSIVRLIEQRLELISRS